MVNILCPKCQNLMVIMDRQGIHIDYCTQCHGIYLDRGELEKLISLSVSSTAVAQPQQQQPHYLTAQPIPPQRPYRHDDDDDDDDRHRGRRRKGGWLGDIFDFD